MEFVLHIPLLASFLCGNFSYTSCTGFIFYLGSFSYTSRAGFIFLWGVSYTSRAGLFFFLGSFSYTSRAGFIFMQGVCLTHPVLASFLCREFVLHIPCWLHFYAGSFSYTSHAVLQKWLKIILGEFLSHIPCWLLLCREFFTSYAGCIMWEVSLTCPMLAV